MVAVGDAGKIKAMLEKYGTVEVYDANGALVPPCPRRRQALASAADALQSRSAVSCF